MPNDEGNRSVLISDGMTADGKAFVHVMTGLKLHPEMDPPRHSAPGSVVLSAAYVVICGADGERDAWRSL